MVKLGPAIVLNVLHKLKVSTLYTFVSISSMLNNRIYALFMKRITPRVIAPTSSLTVNICEVSFRQIN